MTLKCVQVLILQLGNWEWEVPLENNFWAEAQISQFESPSLEPIRRPSRRGKKVNTQEVSLNTESWRKWTGNCLGKGNADSEWNQQCILECTDWLIWWLWLSMTLNKIVATFHSASCDVGMLSWKLVTRHDRCLLWLLPHPSCLQPSSCLLPCFKLAVPFKSLFPLPKLGMWLSSSFWFLSGFIFNFLWLSILTSLHP